MSTANASLAYKLTRALIQIDSTDPGHYETDIEAYLKKYLKQLPGVLLQEDEILPGRFNLMAEIPGEFPEEPSLIFICHMDTVVVGDGWTMPPFDAVEKDRKIYGRGACDMKSGLACCLSAFTKAAHTYAASGKKPFRSLKLICTVDEEDFMRGAEGCITRHWVRDCDWVLDSEPTNGQIQVAHKGRTWFEIEVTGHTAHASTPWKGADAIAAIAEIIREIRLQIQAAPEDAELGSSTVTFGQITGGYRPYVVPDHAKVWIDMRLVPPTDTKKAVSIVEKAIRHAEETIPGIQGSYIITGNRPYVEKDPDSALLHHLRTACQNTLHTEPVVGIFPGYTDTAVIAGTLHSHNCMSYGPGNLECAHKPDEWVAIEDILRCEEVYQELAREVLEK